MLALMRRQSQAAPEPIEQEHAQRTAENVRHGLDENSKHWASRDVMGRLVYPQEQHAFASKQYGAAVLPVTKRSIKGARGQAGRTR